MDLKSGLAPKDHSRIYKKVVSATPCMVWRSSWGRPNVTLSLLRLRGPQGLSDFPGPLKPEQTPLNPSLSLPLFYPHSWLWLRPQKCQEPMGKRRRAGGKGSLTSGHLAFDPMTPRKGMTQGMTRAGEERQKVRLAGSLQKSGVPTYTGPLKSFQSPWLKDRPILFHRAACREWRCC